MAKYFAATGIPTVDLGVKGGTEIGDLHELGRLAREIGSAFCSNGCAFLINHGIDEDMLSEVIAAKKEFFALKEDVKMQYLSLPGTLFGYLPFNMARYDQNTHDIHEGFIIVSEEEDNLPSGLVPPLLPAVTKAMSSFRTLSFKIMSALSLAIGQEQDYLTKMHQEFVAKKGFSCLRVNHFPPMTSDQPPNAIRFGAHRDNGTITLLATGDEGGLQVCSADGAWIDVPPNNLLLMAGQFLHFYSHKKFIAPLHRVLLPEKVRYGIPRFSVIFFVCPDTHIPLKPPCSDEPDPPTWMDYYSAQVKGVLA
ncbi:uncharacterized protein LOC135093837 [Scylla paramamosain]|uniref:uncharacterized protein LOC135093837 n=1 Tax=Scylla paramamosain TaxID=85552 RepID=UPI003083DC72